MSASGLRFHPLGPIGVETADIEPGRIPEGEAFEALRAAVLQHGLVILPEQHLERAPHIELARRFGTLEDHGFSEGTAHPEVIPISNLDESGRVRGMHHPSMRTFRINESWHTDSSFRPTPASYSLLAAEVLPRAGGETLFASLRLGWTELPEGERAGLRELRVVHDYKDAYARVEGFVPRGATALGDPVSHPLVRRHPDTGEPALFLTGHASGIEGLPPDEGKTLLAKLLACCTREDRVYRHRWRPGDLAIWDNRFMLHRTPGFDGESPRVLHHVRVAGGPVEPY